MMTARRVIPFFFAVGILLVSVGFGVADPEQGTKALTKLDLLGIAGIFCLFVGCLGVITVLCAPKSPQ